MNDIEQKRSFFSVPILSLLVASLALVLSIFLSYRDGRLANKYLALDLQEKRPFLAPVISSKEIGDGQRRHWSWGARNSGGVIAKLLFADMRERTSPNENWKGSNAVRDEIVYPGETLELRGATGKLSGIAVTCIVFEEVKESGEIRRWAGYAQYICTDQFELLSQSGFNPEMQLVHRVEHQIGESEMSTCDAIDWWSKIATVSSNKQENIRK